MLIPKWLTQMAISEAAEQDQAKQSKLRTAKEAVMVNSLHQIDRNERENVRRYTNEKLFGEGELIVADDIRVNSGLGMLMVFVLTVASMGVLFYLFRDTTGPSPAQPQYRLQALPGE